jgi:hypothetical protein
MGESVAKKLALKPSAATKLDKLLVRIHSRPRLIKTRCLSEAEWLFNVQYSVTRRAGYKLKLKNNTLPTICCKSLRCLYRYRVRVCQHCHAETTP